MRRFQKLNTDDAVVNRLQDNLSQALDPITSNPLLDRRVLTVQSLVTGSTNYVAHGLGRPLQGWSIVRQRGSASVYDAQDSNPNPSLTLALVTSGNVVVDIEVF